MSNYIWVYADHWENKISEVSKELLGQASQLAGLKVETRVAAVLMGHQVLPLAEELFNYGADTVYLADDERLQLYNSGTYSKVLENLLRAYQPEIVLLGSTSINDDLAAIVAARLETGLSAHCVDLKINDRGELVQVVPAFGGKVLGDILCPERRPQMATVNKGVFAKKFFPDKTGEIIKVPIVLDKPIAGLQTVEITTLKEDNNALDNAPVIIAGGWGIGGPTGWRLLEELAAELDGAVGCTRPALDEGWTAGEHTMLGTSGVSVSPKLYLGTGISGATHHMVGISGAGIIISINSDPKAPIFEYSDYYIVQDYNEIIPELIKQLRQLNS